MYFLPVADRSFLPGSESEIKGSIIFYATDANADISGVNLTDMSFRPVYPKKSFDRLEDAKQWGYQNELNELYGEKANNYINGCQRDVVIFIINKEFNTPEEINRRGISLKNYEVTGVIFSGKEYALNNDKNSNTVLIEVKQNNANNSSVSSAQFWQENKEENFFDKFIKLFSNNSNPNDKDSPKNTKL